MSAVIATAVQKMNS